MQAKAKLTHKLALNLSLPYEHPLSRFPGFHGSYSLRNHTQHRKGRAYLNFRLVGPCLAGLSTRARPPINLNIKTQSLHYMYREPHTQGMRL